MIAYEKIYEELFFKFFITSSNNNYDVKITGKEGAFDCKKAVRENV
jgi:hypothetical protein